MQNTIKEVVDIAGGEILPIWQIIKTPLMEPFLKKAYAIKDEAAPPGYYIHEVGGAAMGINENESVFTKEKENYRVLWIFQQIFKINGNLR